MHTHPKIRNIMIAAGLVIAFAAVPATQALAQDSGSSSMHESNRTVPDRAADAWITTKVKSEYGITKGISATDISVTTNNGMVRLSGNAGSAVEKAKAERVARSVKGVKGVNASKLMVGKMSGGM